MNRSKAKSDDGKNKNTDNCRLEYESPCFEIRPLQLITLGGTIGTGDSGNINQAPPAPSAAGDAFISPNQPGQEPKDW